MASLGQMQIRLGLVWYVNLLGCIHTKSAAATKPDLVVRRWRRGKSNLFNMTGPTVPRQTVSFAVSKLVLDHWKM